MCCSGLLVFLDVLVIGEILLAVGGEGAGEEGAAGGVAAVSGEGVSTLDTERQIEPLIGAVLS